MVAGALHHQGLKSSATGHVVTAITQTTYPYIRDQLNLRGSSFLCTEDLENGFSKYWLFHVYLYLDMSCALGSMPA